MPSRRQCRPALALQQCGPRCCAVCFRSPWLYLTLVYLSLAIGLTIISYRNFKVYRQPFSRSDCSTPAARQQQPNSNQSERCATPGRVDRKLIVNVTLDGETYNHINLLYNNDSEIECVSNDILANLTSPSSSTNATSLSFACWFHRRSWYARLQPGSFIRSDQTAARNTLIACVILASSCLIFLLLPVWRMFRHRHHVDFNSNNRSNRNRDPMLAFPFVLHHLPPPMYAIVVTERMSPSSPSSSPHSRHRRALSQREASAVIAQLRARYKEKGRTTKHEATESDDMDVRVCAICLEELLDDSEKDNSSSGGGGGVVCFPCDHVFHAGCAEQWLRKGAPKCPYCMDELKLDKLCPSATAAAANNNAFVVGQDDVRVVVVVDGDDDMN